MYFFVYRADRAVKVINQDKVDLFKCGWSLGGIRSPGGKLWTDSVLGTCVTALPLLCENRRRERGLKGCGRRTDGGRRGKALRWGRRTKTALPVGLWWEVGLCEFVCMGKCGKKKRQKTKNGGWTKKTWKGFAREEDWLNNTFNSADLSPGRKRES